MRTIRRISLFDIITSSDFIAVGQTLTPNSSLFRRGITGFFWSGSNENFLTKSSSVKWSEQIDDVDPGVHFLIFFWTKSTHLFFLFFASGRSSFAKGMACSATPSLRLGSLEQPNTTHRFGIVKNIFSSQSIKKKSENYKPSLFFAL